MIKKLIRQMLTAQIFSALTVSLCLLIDSIMIGRFLGVQAIAAYGLANPILLVIGAIGTMLAAGVQVACSRSLGRGSQEETNKGFSSSFALTFGISIPFVILVLLFRGPVATVMGAGTEGELFASTSGYLAGFIVGAPATMGALILVPFLQMAGQSGLLIAAVLTMTIADVAFDLLNVFVFHGGMFGMGLASSLSYYAALIVGGIYFLSKKSVFRFSRKLVTKEKIREMFTAGIPAVFNMASSVVLIYLMNRILLGTGGSVAVAAFSVISTIGNASNCITTGIGGVSLTVSGILYNEEDRNGLTEMIGLFVRYSVFLGLGVGVLLLIFAPYCVALFIPEAGPARTMAILGLRLYATGLIPCCINNAIKNAYQGTEKVRLTEIVSIVEGALLPGLTALILGTAIGTTGCWFYFVIGETLTLVLIALYARKKMGRPAWKDGAVLLLGDEFSVAPEDLLELDLRTVEGVTADAERAGRFCKDHGRTESEANNITLCIEEMGTYIIRHGFQNGKKENHLSVRVLAKPDHWVLRFRDDCGAFDPIHYVPQEEEENLGIRLVLAIASEVRYTYSLNLNNLTIIL